MVPPTVYLAGYRVTGTYYTATYWKDGIATELTSETLGSRAQAIAVSGDTVYVVGSQRQGLNSVAVLWTNGVPTILTDGTKNGSAAGIVVSGSDVYVVGGEIGFDAVGNAVSIAEYWKNGVRIMLPPMTPGDELQASSIAISGSDVYVAGSESFTTQTGPSSYYSGQAATYWKNGVPVTLPGSSILAGAYSVFISGNDVYLSGASCVLYAPNCEQPVYWKNGQLVQLPAESPAAAYSIFVAGNDIFLSENLTLPGGALEAQTWLNGTQVTLSTGPDAGTGEVVLSNGRSYVAGSVGSGYACYWVNSNLVQVADTAVNSIAIGIAVVQN